MEYEIARAGLRGLEMPFIGYPSISPLVLPPSPIARNLPRPQLRYIFTTLTTVFRQTGQSASWAAQPKQAQTWPQS